MLIWSRNPELERKRRMQTQANQQLEAPDCADALARGAVLVDVREPHETRRMAYDHAGCIHMPLSEFERRFGELPHDKLLVMACAAGGRSQQAMNHLLRHGYTNVANLRGGIGGWMRCGLPVRVVG
jgi:rhodanese-related sulfurtransferase